MNTRVGFVHAFKDFWFRAGDFRGSSTRGQYWWIFLMNTLVAVIGVGILLVSGVAATFLAWGQNDNQPLEYVFGGFLGIVVVLILEWFLFQGLPSWALLIRRYRDAGVSPWLLLITRVVPIFLTGLAISTTAVQITIGILYLADLVIKVLPTRQPVPLWSTRPNEDGRRVGMVGAIPEFFRRAGVFSGRSSRSEYWWIVLWGVIIAVISLIVAVPLILFSTYAVTTTLLDPGAGAFRVLWSTIGVVFAVSSLFTLPQFTLLLRRFRDAGVSPWWYGVLWGAQLITAMIAANSRTIAIAWIVYFILWLITLIITVLPSKKPIDNH